MCHIEAALFPGVVYRKVCMARSGVTVILLLCDPLAYKKML
jgi:hypothetical protein